MSNPILNTNYRIPNQTLWDLLSALEEMGDFDAFDIAFNKSKDIIETDPESLLITEYFSWSHNLLLDARATEDSNLKERLLAASRFYRKLAHHLYWVAVKAGTVARSPHFLQAIK